MEATLNVLLAIIVAIHALAKAQHVQLVVGLTSDHYLPAHVYVLQGILSRAMPNVGNALINVPHVQVHPQIVEHVQVQTGMQLLHVIALIDYMMMV